MHIPLVPLSDTDSTIVDSLTVNDTGDDVDSIVDDQVMSNTCMFNIKTLGESRKWNQRERSILAIILMN